MKNARAWVLYFRLSCSWLAAARLFLALTLLVSFSTFAAPVPKAHLSPPVKQPWRAIKRTGNQTEWQTVTIQTNAASGRVHVHTNKFIQLGSGLNIRDGAGKFAAADPSFKIAGNGAKAEGTAHKLSIPADIGGGDGIRVTMPDGEKVTFQPLAVDYYDPTDGSVVLLDVVTNAVGWLVASNEIVFSNCLTSIRASIRIRNSIHGFEQDLILHERPPDPASLGLSAATRLEMLTEQSDGASPSPHARYLRREQNPANLASMVEPHFVDSELNFGGMKMGAGKAFGVGPRTNGSASLTAPVGKSFLTIGQRRVIVEAAEYHRARPVLNQLPAATNIFGITNAALNSTKTKNANIAGTARKLPTLAALTSPLSPRTSETGAASIRPVESMASLAAGSIPGSAGADIAFVLDYTAVNPSGETNFTFRGDTTYLVSGYTPLYETTTIEGGTVVKFQDLTGLFIQSGSTFICDTTNYLPAVFTSVDDDTVGESTGGSPPPWQLSVAALNFPEGTFEVRNMRFKYLGNAIQAFGPATITARNVQFVDLFEPFALYSGGTLNVFNALARDIQYFYEADAVAFHGEHITAHNVLVDFAYLYTPGGSSAVLKNSLLAAVPLPLNLGTTYTPEPNTVHLSSDTGVFQTCEGGEHYLAEGSSYRDIGTTDIDIELQNSLSEMTTYAPTLLEGTPASDLVLNPQVTRDTEAPDLGYHYPAIDYVAKDLLLDEQTIVMTNGVVVAGAPSWQAAIILAPGKLISHGEVLRPNRLIRVHQVHENVTQTVDSMILAGNTAPFAPEIVLRFTEISGLASSYYFLNIIALSRVELSHSAVYNGWNFITTGGGATELLGLTNTLFKSVVNVIDGSSHDMDCFVYNNLFKDGSVQFHPVNTDWAIYDNVFDHCIIMDYGGPPIAGYNAYIGTLTNFSLDTGPSYISSTLTYTAGPLGKYYVSGTELADLGSRTVGAAGLAHFTTRPDQAKDTGTVDIGLHYVALTVGNVPADFDGDRLADYIEDKNGNGAVDSGETSWTASDTDGDGLSDFDEPTRWLTNPLSADSDGDGLSDYLEVFTYHTSPTFADTDGDGLTDGQEVLLYLTNPFVRDSDGDGLSDRAEVVTHGTNPNLADTDGDRISDWEEIFSYGSSPLSADTDNNGLPDTWDVFTFAALDSDQDGMIDEWEHLSGGDLDWFGNPDGDGLINLDEFFMGTDPLNADSDGDGIPDGMDSDPSISSFLNPQIWVDDATPGGTLFGQNESWRWVADFPVPPFGTYVHVSAAVRGFHEHGFTGATNVLPVSAGDKLITYVYLDPRNRPTEIMLKWTATDGTEAAAYWGDDRIAATGKVRIGELPSCGRWFLLQAPVSELGLGGKQLNGMAFSLFDGWAQWDGAGKVPGDSDSDGLLDEWERKYFGNLAQTAAGDSDGDGLSNLQEVQAGTNPTAFDTDADGLSDGEELILGTDPLKPISPGNLVLDGMADADGDGLINMMEFSYYGTDPKNAYSLDPTKQANDALMKLAYAIGVNVTPLKLAFVSVVPNVGVNYRLDGTSAGVNYLIISSVVWPGTMQYEMMIAGANGSTSFFVPFNNRPTLFLQAGVGDDSDGDGLPDGYEVLVTRTSPDTEETIPGQLDATADYNHNGIDNYHEYIMPLRIGIYASDPNATETGLPGEATITLPRPAPVGGLSVAFYDTPSSGAAGTYLLYDEAGTLLVGSPKTVVIPAGRTDYHIKLFAIDDGNPNSVQRTVTFSLRTVPPPSGYTSAEVDAVAAVVYIRDDEAPASIDVTGGLPTLSVTVFDGVASEVELSDPDQSKRLGEFTITITRANNVYFPITARFNVTGTAVRGKDYRLLDDTTPIGKPIGNTIVIPAFANSATVKVEASHDLEPEFLETVTLTLEPAFEYKLGNVYSGTVDVDDNEPAQYRLTAETNAWDTAPQNAADTVGAFKLTRTGSIKTASPSYTCNLSGAAIFGTQNPGYSPLNCDYVVKWNNGFSTGGPEASSQFSHFFPANSGTNWFFIVPRSDLETEPDESVELTLSGAVNAFEQIVVTGQKKPLVNVYQVSADVTQSPAGETATGVARPAFLVSRVRPTPAGAWTPYNPAAPGELPENAPEFEVYFKVAGTADPNFDYSVAVNAGVVLTRHSADLYSVRLPAQQASVKIFINPVNDGVAEPVESIIATILDNGTYPVAKRRQADMRLRDVGGVDRDTDTDGDGILDKDETRTAPYTDALIRDSDGNGIPDGINLMNPADTNGDRVNDLIEFLLFILNTDTDGDGISNSRELLIGTDPVVGNAEPTDTTKPVIQTLISPTETGCSPNCKVTRL